MFYVHIGQLPVTEHHVSPRRKDIGGERQAASAVSRLRPVAVVRSGGTSRYQVNNMSVSVDSALVTRSNRATPIRAAANEEVPWQLTAWLEAGLVSAAFRAPGGTELRSLKTKHKAVVAYDGRPNGSFQTSITRILANTTQWMADIAFEHSAMALSWHILSEINGVNEQAGLAVENLHVSLQELTLNLLQSLGCATAWATPMHRPLPAAAAGLVPGTIGKLSLQQCLQLECHTPAVCYSHYDGSWDGTCTIYLPQHQLLPVTELGKALTRDKVMHYLDSCSSRKSLSELLLLQLYKALLVAGPKSMLQLQHGKQQQQRQLAHTAAAATAAAVADDASHSTVSFTSGGGKGHRGDLTAVGADGDDEMASNLTLVPTALNRQQRNRQARLVSPLVAASSTVSSSSSSSGSSKPRGKQGVLRRFGSALRRLCCKALRA